MQAYYDIGNMQKFAPSHEWIRILGTRNVKLDVKDWGVKNGFCRLGQGDVDWKAVRKELEIPTGELTKADFEKVTRLSLGFTNITDAGLKDIAKLQNLTDLILSDTKITYEGVAELRKAMPNCKIYHSYKKD